jgi:hypothetical protein
MGNFWLTELRDHQGWYLYPMLASAPEDIGLCFNVPDGFARLDTRSQRFVQPARFELVADGRWHIVEKGEIAER